MKILDGKKVAQKLQHEIRDALTRPFPRKPCLVAVLTTDNPASLAYVQKKAEACREVGVESRIIKTSPKDTQELLLLIDSLNCDSTVDAVLVQLPLPEHIDPMQVLERVDPLKDVDGFHPINMGRMILGDPHGFCSCTPLGIKMLLESYSISVSKKHVVIVGRSNIVGKPLACLLVQNAPGCNATVTIAHSQTKDLLGLCKTADILIAAVGKPGCITADMIRPGAVVVDVGINKVLDSSKKSGYRLVGDVDYENVFPKVSAITPVPGGVGPMTIAALLKNTLKSFMAKMA